MHHFFSIFSLLAIIGHVSVQSKEIRSERSVNRAYRSILTVSNGGKWGSWGYKQMCPIGMYAAGFSLKVEGYVARGDNTALNGIRLYCIYYLQQSSGLRDNPIESDVGNAGQWTDIKWCHSGYLTSFQLRVQSSQGRGDDTAANNIKFGCSGGFLMRGDGFYWGYWGNWSPTCHGKGICGIQTRIEESQGSGDDTSLNDVIMFCCD